MAIRVTPTGQLRWEAAADETLPAALEAAVEAFQADWRGALFGLAAARTPAPGAPTVRYWQQLAEHYLAGLCHFPADTETFELGPPAAAQCAEWLLAAPPMQGGEYLSEERLQGIWASLDQWVHETVGGGGGLAAFLRARAPRWHQVGRVCFHLAENKSDPALPFAFMATYTAGFSAAGRLRHVPLRSALEQYSGANNRAALIKLLAPVQQAARACGWVRELVDSGAVYRATAWSPQRSYQFLQSIPELERSGLTVRVPNWWRKRARPQVSVTIGSTPAARLDAAAMLDFKVEVAVGDTPLTPQELAALLDGDDSLVLLKNQWVEVDRDQLRQAIAHWETLQQDAEEGGISFVEGMRLLAGASADLRQEERAEAERPWVQVTAGAALRETLARLRHPAGLAAVTPGAALQGTLRPYQRDGVAWLYFLQQLGLGACLADDMGLGKTIQVLALLLCRRRAARDRPPAPGSLQGAGSGKSDESNGADPARAPHSGPVSGAGNGEGEGSDGADPARESGPALLVVPASLLGNWRSEAARFAPALQLLFLHPAETDRAALTEIAAAPEGHLQAADLVITTYAMVPRQPWLAQVAWELVILDEAQAIKNPAARQSRAVRALPARARIALTGTPVENRLGDLWTLFDFLNPGLLGSRTVFQAFIKELQRRPQNPFAPLRRLVSPYILRRLKTDRTVIADLPAKTETTQHCHLTAAQIKRYRQVVRGLQRDLESGDQRRRRGVVLGALLRLKQVCNHPSQLLGDGAYHPAASGKFLRLAEICTELAERQERVLVFTQFREIIDPLAAYLATVFARPGLVLHGGTRVSERRELVAQFQSDDGPPFLILSLKAGGTGLNLTAAAHVIHFDRWWNPAVENQATDRAFRIGQQRNVLVHKFVTEGTVEQRIDRLMEEKRKLADDVVDGAGEIKVTELSDAELVDLVRLNVTSAQHDDASLDVGQLQEAD